MPAFVNVNEYDSPGPNLLASTPNGAPKSSASADFFDVVRDRVGVVPRDLRADVDDHGRGRELIQLGVDLDRRLARADRSAAEAA